MRMEEREGAPKALRGTLKSLAGVLGHVLVAADDPSRRVVCHRPSALIRVPRDLTIAHAPALRKVRFGALMLAHYVLEKGAAWPLSLRLACDCVNELQIGLHEATAELRICIVDGLLDRLALVKELHEFAHLGRVEVDVASTDAGPGAQAMPSLCKLRAVARDVLDHPNW